MLLLARARTRVPPIQHCSKNAEYRGTENLKVLCRIPEFVVKTLDCGCRALAHSIGRVGRMKQLGEAARETSPFVVEDFLWSLALSERNYGYRLSRCGRLRDIDIRGVRLVGRFGLRR
jgi:hypothetical protein